MLNILRDEEVKKPERAADRTEQLTGVMAERFSCTEMARHTLGQEWTLLEREDRQEFVRLYRLLLLKTYVHHIERYADQRVEYLEELTEAGRAIVRTKVIAHGREVLLDFWLFEREGDWKVFDVVMGNVSLTQNYRGQFTRVLRLYSYAHLMERIRERACAPDCDEQAALENDPRG